MRLSELLYLLCSVTSGGNCNCSYRSGMLFSIFSHVRVASLCKYMFIGSMFVASCRVRDEMRSDIPVFVINLSALF